MIILLDIGVVKMLLKRIVKFNFAVAPLKALQDLCCNICIDLRLDEGKDSLQIDTEALLFRNGDRCSACGLHLNDRCFLAQTDRCALCLCRLPAGLLRRLYFLRLLRY